MIAKVKSLLKWGISIGEHWTPHIKLMHWTLWLGSALGPTKWSLLLLRFPYSIVIKQTWKHLEMVKHVMLHY